MLQLALAAPAAAVGPCEFSKRLAPRDLPGRAPLAVGDSVMLGASEALAHAGFRVNARGCRPMSDGLDLLAGRKRLPPVVVVALGTNFDVSRAEIARAVKILGPERRLVLVTPPNGGDDPARIRRAARRRDDVCVADWARRVQAHPEYAPGDGIHLSAAGISAYARMLKPFRRGACA